MRRSILSLVIASGLATGSLVGPLSAAGDGVEATAETAAVRELLEGSTGRHETWSGVPELVVLTSVMEFATTDARSGYTATAERLSRAFFIAV